MSTVTAMSAVLRIPVERIQPGPNARGAVGDATELALSLKTLGQQEPLLVTDLGDGRYQVFDGHRRLAAARKAGLPTLDAVVRRDDGPAARLQQQLAMHTQSKAFDPMAEAEALHKLMFDHNLSREDIARAVGKSPAWVRDRIALMHLEPGEKQAVRAGRMSLAQAAATLAWRRSERDGRQSTQPQPTTTLKRPALAATRPQTHCPTCQCPKRGEAA